MSKKRLIAFAVLFLGSVLLISAAAEKPARTVFVNGAVYTMNPKQPWAEAVVVEGDKIVFVGASAEARKLAAKATQVVDLRGRMMLPGFIESHAHPLAASTLPSDAMLDHDLGREGLLNEIKKQATAKPADPAVLMMGFKAAAFGPNGPTAADLDAIESKRPVVILDDGGHSAWLNSAALRLGGIAKDTPDPLPGGQYYQRDKNGNPTGWCVESTTFAPLMIKLGLFSTDKTVVGAKKLFPVFPALGFTSVYDAGDFDEDAAFKAFLQLEKERQLPFRVFASHMVRDRRRAADAVDELKRLHQAYDSPLVKVNTLKILLDGTLEAKNCGMFEPFIGERGNKGFVLLTADALNDLVRRADDAGFNIHIHAIGNRTISEALGAFEKLQKEKGLTPTRKTICHVQFFMPDTVERFKKLKAVTAQTTPLWQVPDASTRSLVGKEIYERQALFNSLDKAGVNVTFGSDFPASGGLEGANPFNEIEVGHTRRKIGAPDTDALAPAAERMPVEALLRGYTINGARQLGVEDKLGSIEAGKLADLIVLDKNILKQDAADIHNNRVLLTVRGGEVVYDASVPAQ